MYFKIPFYTFCIILLAGSQLRLLAQNDIYARKVKFVVQKTDPPVFNFYTKVVYSDSIPIRSLAKVNNDALILAAMKMRVMLRFMPSVRHNLIQWGVEMHIIGTGQSISDLPEYQQLKGVPYKDNRGITYKSIDDRARGLGGFYACCPEENLLGWQRYDICAHEFAHVVMGFGLDNVLRAKITAQYKKAISRGLWKGEYAAVNALEYWAEISARYFGANSEPIGKINFTEGTSASDALNEYDAEGYALADSIYTGSLQPAMISMVPAKKVKPDSAVESNSQRSRFTVINNTSEKIIVYKLVNGVAISNAMIFPYGYATTTNNGQSIMYIADEYGRKYGYYLSDAPNCKIIVTQ